MKEYAVINIGHPDIVPIADLAEMIRKELNAPEELLRTIELPERMTLIKRPVLTRQTELLKVIPEISLQRGVQLVCSRIQQRIRMGETIQNGS